MSVASSTSAEGLERLGELARQSVRSQAALLQRSTQLSRDVLSGERNWTDASRSYLRDAGREGAHYLLSVGRLSVDYLGEVIHLGNELTESLLDPSVHTAQRSPRRRPSSPGPTDDVADPPPPPAPTDGTPDPVTAATPRLIPLELSGRLGGRVEGLVTVSNRHTRARSVRLQPGALRGPAGDVTAATIDLDPSRVTVPAGQEQDVTVGVELSADSFTAGEHYSGTVVISGGDQATVELGIEVTR